MVNKKGFIRIIESIVAILIVLGFITILLTSGDDVPESDIPYQLKVTVESLVKQVQNQPDLRQQILQASKDPSPGEKDPAIVELDNYISKSLTETSPLDYAFTLTFSNANTNYYYRGTHVTKDQAIPAETSVYVKKVFITVDDVTSGPEEKGQSSAPNEYTTFTIYMWYKID